MSIINFNNVFNFFLNDPLEQFVVNPLFTGVSSVWFSSIIIWLGIIFTLIGYFFWVCTLNTSVEGLLVHNFLLDAIYNLVKSIMKSNISMMRQQYFIMIFFLFIFILTANLLGLIPYSFTVTSSFAVTLGLALMYFIAINIIGVYAQQWKAFSWFLPQGVPLYIAPILVPIEIISYIARILSLSIRLFANMMSGHALLKILIGFSWILLSSSFLFSFLAIAPWILVTLIFALEILIAFLQAYVFVILVSIYINDVISAH